MSVIVVGIRDLSTRILTQEFEDSEVRETLLLVVYENLWTVHGS